MTVPYSSTEGKDWTVARIVAHAPDTVLDIGAGAGTYETLLRPLLPTTRFRAVEVWWPYVQRFNLLGRYDGIILADVMDLDPLPAADVVILGDVLEHLVQPEAIKLWARARAAARTAVFLSLPVLDYPQGEVDGNPYEAHRHGWTHDSVLAELPGITAWWSLPWPTVVRAYEATPTTNGDGE